jgi:hypothetical protein
MGIEMILFLVLGQLVEASMFLEQNFAPLLATTLLVVLSTSGSITVLRRWRSE